MLVGLEERELFEEPLPGDVLTLKDSFGDKRSLFELSQNDLFGGVRDVKGRVTVWERWRNNRHFVIVPVFEELLVKREGNDLFVGLNRA